MTHTKFRIYKNTSDKKNIINDTLISLLVFFVIVIILTNPSRYAKSFLNGLVLFFSSVLPGLFPFMFLTKILTNMNSVKKLSSKCGLITNILFRSPGIGFYVLIMSNISGYPIGAKIIGDLHSNQIITDNEAKKIVTYSMTSGPAFIVGSVGALMFKNIIIGIIILISHLIANIITGIIFCKPWKKEDSSPNKSESSIIKNINTDKILSDSMYSSIQAILLVGGFISIFYCISDILIDLKIFEIISYPLVKIFDIIGIPSSFAQGIMSGIIEVTRGCKELSILFSSWPSLSVSLSCMLISFSGLSIIIQSKAFLSGTQIKTHFLLITKSVHAIISFIICFILCGFLL